MKLPSNEPRELPHCLQRYQPTSVPRRPARPKRPVGRPRKTPRESSAADSDNPEPCGLSESAAELSRGVLRGLPIGHFGRAGRRGTDVGWYRCRQCGNSRGSFEGSRVHKIVSDLCRLGLGSAPTESIRTQRLEVQKCHVH